MLLLLLLLSHSPPGQQQEGQPPAHTNPQHDKVGGHLATQQAAADA
jgi:hypothetical protein